MSNRPPHVREIAKTLAPTTGPETPADAVVRLMRYYERLDCVERYAFVSVLVADYVAGRATALVSEAQ